MSRTRASRAALWLGFCAFTAIAAVFLWLEHRAHLAGAYGWLPWLVILLCPAIHIFMHRRHQRHDDRRDESSRRGHP